MYAILSIVVTYAGDWRSMQLWSLGSARIVADCVTGALQSCAAESTAQHVQCTLNGLNFLKSFCYLCTKGDRFLCTSLNSSSTWIIL